MKPIKVAGATLNQTPLDWSTNFNNIKEAIQTAKKAGVELLCLPELCITGYGCEDAFLAPWVAEEALNQLIQLLPFTAEIAVVVGLPLRHQGQLYNCCCIIEDTKILGFTAKQFLANDGVHYELRWFTPWERGRTDDIAIDNTPVPIGNLIYTIKGVKVGLEICEDAWKEALRPAWQYFKAGVEIILNPSASHFALGKAHLRELLVISSARRFNCLYVYVNLLGNEAGRIIYGGDILFGVAGKVIKQNKTLSFKNYNLLYLDYDADESAAAYESHDDEEQLNQAFAQAVALALFDYMRKSKSRGFVLSLSGGADSSACAVLIGYMIRLGVAELGFAEFLKKIGRPDLIVDNKAASLQQQCAHIAKNIFTCAYQGTANSSEATFISAESLALSLGATFHHWTIDEEVRSYTGKVETALKRQLSWEVDDIALQNIQARARSPVIWMMANIQRALLITTSNRSEGDVGYATMDGDTSGSIAPVAGIDKYFLLQWLQWAEKSLGYEGLKSVNALIPSAELRPAGKEQTDEKDLMPYHVIVEIERLAIRDRKSPIEVYQILNDKALEPKPLLKTHIKKFFTLWARNQWKRERTAPSFHLDDFNVDPKSWCRFPILSGSFDKELEALSAID